VQQRVWTEDVDLSEQNLSQVQMPDPAEVAKTMARVAEQSQRVVQEFFERQASPEENGYSIMDPTVVMRAFQEFAQQMMVNPATVWEAQMELWQGYMNLWQSTARRMLGEEAAPAVTPDPDDRRFKDDAWRESPVFDYIKQSYLLASRYLQSCVQGTDGLDPATAKKVEFYTRQFVDAMAPTNFVLTNPQVLRRTVETGGENLLQGLSNLLEDLERGRGQLRISMTDTDAFDLGENVAVTPGAVVYQNDLMQLIQYEPATKTVYKRPLLIIPPWINKYYILDLRPKNSFIKWAVEQGHTVFVISWVNPDEQLADKTFEDYMFEGTLAALDAIEQATGEREVKVIGYCLGGTLLAGSLAYMVARGDDRFKSATYFVSLVEFTEVGDLSVFSD